MEIYIGIFEIEGTKDLIMHRWSLGEKPSAPYDPEDLECMLYRHKSGSGELALPGEYFRQSLIGASKFKQDPRHPRRSAMDLLKAGICCLEDRFLCGLGVTTFDYVYKASIRVQNQRIERFRPAMRVGWKCEFPVMVGLGEFITPELLREVGEAAGRLSGVGDFRPTFGQFKITNFSVFADEAKQALAS